MPTYEYECEVCGYRFERFHKMEAEPLKICPECGGPVNRLISSGTAVIFKGGGSPATESREGGSRAPRCGQSRTCCGRDVPCDTPPCGS